MRPDLEARGYRVFEISAVSHEGLRELTFALAEVVEPPRAPRPPQPPEKPRIVIRPRAVDEREFTIRVEGGTYGDIYRVLGAKPERWVAADRLPERGGRRLSSPTGSRSSASRTSCSRPAPSPARRSSSAGDGVVFDWEPTLTSVAELHAAPAAPTPASTDDAPPDQQGAPRELHERMDAKAEARAELEAERAAGMWSDEQVRDEANDDGVSVHSRAQTSEPPRASS